MSIIGGILKYSLVLLIIALGLGIVIAGAMVLIPDLYVFGIHYIGYGYKTNITVSNETEQSAEVDQSYNAFLESKALLINANGYDVQIRTINTASHEIELDDTFRFTVNHSMTGFAWGDIKMPYTSYGQTVIDGELVYKIEIVEPSGWLFHAQTYIEVVIDENALKDKELIINGTSGKFSLGPDIRYTSENVIASDLKVLNLNQVKIKNDSGDVTFKYVNFVKSSENGLPSATITKKSGTFQSYLDLKCELLVSVDEGFGKVLFNDVMAENGGDGQYVRISAANSEIRFGTIKGDLDLDCKGGYLRGTKVTGSVDSKCTSCDIGIGEIGDYFTHVGTESNVSINTVNGYAEVKTTDGFVTLGKTLDTAIVETNKGNITLSDVYKSVEVKSLYGIINVTWNRDLSYNSSLANEFQTIVKSKYGSVYVNNVIGSVSMQAIENGTAAFTATYLQVNDASSIQTNAGAVSLVLPTTMPYFLKWASGANADIREYGQYISTEKTGEIHFLDGSENGPKIDIRSSTGKITIRGSY